MYVEVVRLSVSGSKGLPMLPPRCTFTPLAFKNSEIIVVVVVLPSEPVIAMILHGQRSKNTSISEVSTTPFSLNATRSGL